MTDIKQYLKETNTVLLTKESFEYLKERASALDKIRAEIEQYEADCVFADDSKECKECDKVVFGTIYRIIDKYKAEVEPQESEETQYE